MNERPVIDVIIASRLLFVSIHMTLIVKLLIFRWTLHPLPIRLPPSPFTLLTPQIPTHHYPSIYKQKKLNLYPPSLERKEHVSEKSVRENGYRVSIASLLCLLMILVIVWLCSLVIKCCWVPTRGVAGVICVREG